ncbi:MAG: PQQ-binding-like beta-propeller repeat protein [Planctomycetes bacterium]|nr:PQQ-binding-like beta-propeller repeat protein [Planctomycetota bacterium]
MDDALRALARAAEGRPDDAAAGWALAQALARAGDRRGERRAIARLARAGDLAAREAHARLAPWPSRSGEGLTFGARLGPAGPLRVERRAPVDLAPPVLAGATQDVVLVASPEGLVAHDARDLAPRWRAPLSGPAWYHVGVVAGDVLVLDGQDLVLLDGAAGAPVARAALGGTVAAVSLHVDLAAVELASSDEERTLALVDVGARFGRVLWSRPVGHLSSFDAAGPWLVVASYRAPGELEVLRLETGDRVWASGAPAGAGARHWSLLCADAHGLVVHGAGGDEEDRTAFVCELEPTGHPRWRVEGLDVEAFGQSFAMDGDVFLAAVRRREGRDLICVERRTGQRRWSTPVGAAGEALVVAAGRCHALGLEEMERTLRRPGGPRWGGGPDDPREAAARTLYGDREPVYDVRRRLVLTTVGLEDGRAEGTLADDHTLAEIRVDALALPDAVVALAGQGLLRLEA